MKIKHEEIIINQDDPFENCQLDRAKFAKILTSIVSSYADGFVLAINNEWGTGKTTFVKMWKRQLELEGFQTLYFNAWANDFASNPLIAFISEFNSLSKTDTKEYLSLLHKSAVITKNVLPKLLKAIASKYIETGIILEALENATKGATEILQDELNLYQEKKQGIKEFKKSLTKFVNTVKGNKPLIFIIDELDRCRPNYGVEMLEQIKHFLTVPGIIYVLSIDKEQLGNAVRGVYGSDRINADEYLRRFIDLEYSIPNPEVKVFVRYLFNYFDFNEILLSQQRKNIHEFRYEPDEIINLASLLFDKANLSLRQQEKIFAHARIGLRSLIWNQYLFPTIFLFLIYIKNHHSSIYKKLQKKLYSTQELLNEIYKIFPKGVNQDNLYIVIHLEALMANLYNNYFYDRLRRFDLIEQNKETGEDYITIQSNFDTSGQEEFKKQLRSILAHRECCDLSIKFVLDKIDLIQEVKV